MNSTKEHTNIFNASLVSEAEHDGVVYRMYSNRIYHVIIPSMKSVGMEVVEFGLSFIAKNGGGKFYNIYEFNSFSDIKPEMREWASDPNGNDHTYTDALVIHSLSQKILADFYIRVNKPVKSTKVFYSLEKAVKWTLSNIS